MQRASYPLNIEPLNNAVIGTGLFRILYEIPQIALQIEFTIFMFNECHRRYRLILITEKVAAYRN